jgi:ribonuclease HI
MAESKEVIIYTDGGCEPNPGAGGYGAVLICGCHRKELSGGFRLTTNNRMELYAVIAALEALKKPCKVKLYSDSKYLVEAMTLGWVGRWEKKGWKKAKNPDLWKQITELCRTHEVEFFWVKGHAGNPNNERCDTLALGASKSENLPIDEIYENSRNTQTTGNVPESEPGSKRTISNYLNAGQSKVKIVEEGQPCRKCLTPVIKKTPRKKTPKQGQSYYYEYLFLCPNCKTMYMVDDAKRDYSIHGGES